MVGSSLKIFSRDPSPKQAKVLEFIERQISATGLPPSYRDIAAHCGSALGTIQDHVRALVRKGFLETEPGLARGLRPSHRSRAANVPILGTVPAGRPLEAIEAPLGMLSVSSLGAGDAAPGRRPPPRAGELYALRVHGESMTGAGILDGDYVIVRKQEDALSGEIVVALLEGEATVKRLERKGGRIRLLPANPEFDPIDIPPTGESGATLIWGKVIGVQRFYA
jgi:repressor LexA